MIHALLFEEVQQTEIVGGLVGDAIKNASDTVWQGIVYGFKYICLVGSNVVTQLAGLATIGEEAVYFASKDSRDKGRIVKYIVIYLGACTVGWLINAI